MTPEEYRTKWKLPRDYPMVAHLLMPNSVVALPKQIGLGRKKGDAVTEEAAAPKPARAKAAQGRQGAGCDAAQAARPPAQGEARNDDRVAGLDKSRGMIQSRVMTAPRPR